jgi:hypothetical protein
VIAETLNGLFGFNFDALHDGGVGGVLTASKHEILPDEETELVADVVEDIGFVDTCASETSASRTRILPCCTAYIRLRVTLTSRPNSNHVLIPINHQLQPRSIPIIRDLCQERVCWDPIGTTTEHTLSVDLEEEGSAWLVLERLLDDLGGSETDTVRLDSEGRFVLETRM